MKKLNEHEAISEDEKALLLRCSDAIKRADPSAEVILYGSRASGKVTPESDYDLLILIDGEATLKTEEIICRQLYPIELETGKVLSAMVYSRQQWDTPLYRIMPFHKNVEKDGVVL